MRLYDFSCEPHGDDDRERAHAFGEPAFRRPPDLDRPGDDRARHRPRLDHRDRHRRHRRQSRDPGRRARVRHRPRPRHPGGHGRLEPQPAQEVGAVGSRADARGADGRGRAAHARVPAGVGRAEGLADLRQLDLPGQAFPAPADARAGALLPLSQPRCQHAQGARPALGAAGAAGGAEGIRAHRAQRRARFDRGTAPLPGASRRTGRAGRLPPCTRGCRGPVSAPAPCPLPRVRRRHHGRTGACPAAGRGC